MLKVNHSSCMSKTLRKAVIKRSDPDKKYLKKKKDQSLRAYKKQQGDHGGWKSWKTSTLFGVEGWKSWNF